MFTLDKHGGLLSQSEISLIHLWLISLWFMANRKMVEKYTAVAHTPTPTQDARLQLLVHPGTHVVRKAVESH